MKKTAISFVFNFYRTLRTILGSGACPHTPSCSAYAQEAFSKYPFVRAFFLSAKRLLRCHPFSKGGFDPVP
ncbi:MAG: membrane protein insertion efficiency factor YidD [Elusimicrobia bacterium]|nr:membrane protein insertion efficiency factor YidD [Elusimicrobiota bacterium]